MSTADGFKKIAIFFFNHIMLLIYILHSEKICWFYNHECFFFSVYVYIFKYL